MILTWITYIATFLLGYIIGLNFCVNVSQETKNKLQTTYKKIRQKRKPTKLGAIDKIPYEEEIKKGTRLEETEKAMEETLDNVLPRL